MRELVNAFAWKHQPAYLGKGSLQCSDANRLQHRRHPEVLAVLHGEPRRMGHKRLRPSFETPRKRAAPQDDDGGVAISEF
jgi:hypothetical protein